LFNNTVTGKNVSLVVNKKQLHKAVNVIHGEIFDLSKKVNIAVFGHGLVGSALINQVLNSKTEIENRKGIELNIFAIANSKQIILNKEGVDNNWQEQLNSKDSSYNIEDVIDYAQTHHLENLIAVDNTASKDFHKNYEKLVKAGFDLVSSNKIANTISHDFYAQLRQTLKSNKKEYLYETTVGAGLPLIDTIKLLHESGENITRIRGVFSGTLSYLFNTFSSTEKSFSTIINETVEKGFTEPDPREDFSGNDVARKLLILARELDLKNEFSDIEVENLIPEKLQGISTTQFLNSLEDLDEDFQKIKHSQKENHVLRYVGDLYGDLSQNKGELKVQLVSIPNESALGLVKGSDAIFEIFTESYGENPIVIQGAGAGAQVTARGVFGDILRLSKTIN
jgi:homoserine dehydrogenase